MTKVSVDGAEIHYTVVGQGPNVVLLHGAGGNGAIWYHQVPALSHKYRLVIMDHRGFGRSTAAPHEVDIRHFASDLKAVLDAEKIDRAALVCQSMGGWTGLGFARRWPDQVSAIVLSATPGGLMVPEVRSRFAQAVERAKTEPAANLVLTREFQSAHPEEAWLYEQLSSFNMAGSNILAQLADPKRGFSAEDFADWQIPTLMIAGQSDPIFPSAGLEAVQSILSGADLKIVPDASHSPYMENPRVFNNLVLSFLSSLSH